MTVWPATVQWMGTPTFGVRYTLNFTCTPNARQPAMVTIKSSVDEYGGLASVSVAAIKADGTTISEASVLLGHPSYSSLELTVDPGDRVSVSYVAEFTPTMAVERTLTSQLFVKRSDAVDTDLPLAVRASVQVDTFRTYLAQIQRAPEPPVAAMPQLIDGNFDLMAGTGWSMRPASLAYLYASFGIPKSDSDPSNRAFAWLGGKEYTESILRQSVTIPAGYNTAGLRFRYWVASQENKCDKDHGLLLIEAGNPPQVQRYPFQLCRDGNTLKPGRTTGWRNEKLDLTALISRTNFLTVSLPLTFTFDAILDGDRNSNLWIDNVALCTDTPYAIGGVPCTNAEAGE